MGKKVPDTKNNYELCNCPDCPSFKNSPLTGALYCSVGKAEQTVLEGGCMCAFCPVANENGLALEYYCVRGKSADIPGG